MFLAGPYQPESLLLASIGSTHILTLLIRWSSFRRYASGTRPSRKYGPLSHASPLPPRHDEFTRSGQKSSRLPVRPAAWISNCCFNQPDGFIVPRGNFI